MARNVVGGRRSKKLVIGAAFISLTLAAVGGTSVLAFADTTGPNGTANCDIRIFSNGDQIIDHPSVENLDAGDQIEVETPANQGIPAEGAAVTVVCDVNRAPNSPERQYTMNLLVTGGGEPSCPTCSTNFTTLMDATSVTTIPAGNTRQILQMGSELNLAQALGKFIRMAGDHISVFEPPTPPTPPGGEL